MKHHIDPTVDCVFKAILGKEENKNLLIHFLNAILQRRGAARIVDVVIANPYNAREFQQGKLSIVDVKAFDRQGRTYQIEIQRAIHAGLAERMLFMWSAIYHASLRKGENFVQLRPVLAIWLLREPLFPHVAAYHLPFEAYNLRHRLRLTEHLAIHLLQLSQWRLTKRRPDARDRWLYFFKEGKQIDPAHPPALLQTKEMKQAMNVLVDFSEHEKNYLLYEQRLEAERVELTWKTMLAQERHARERLQRQVEQEHQATERERQEKERLRRQVEQEHQATERERQEKERLRREKEQEHQAKERLLREKEQEHQEKERLQALLRQAGIDPTPTA